MMNSLCGLFAFSILVAACNPFESQKSDVLGFEPGMTYQTAKELIASNSYNCREPSNAFTECLIDNTKLTAYYGNQLPGRPVVIVSAEFSFSNWQSAAQSIAQQYRVDVGKPDTRGNYVWTVGKGNRLTLGPGGVVLDNPDLKKRDAEADSAAAKGAPRL